MSARRRNTGPRLVPATALVLAALAMVALGCASAQKVVSRPGKTTVAMQCDSTINEGLVLTLDLLLVNEDEAQNIRQTGREWFYSDLRRQLETRTRTVSVEGGCRRTVELEAKKGDTVLAIIADYRAPSSDPDQGHMQFKDRKEWKGEDLRIVVHSAYMEVKEAR